MTTRTVCPVCLCEYSAALQRAGARCGDLSHGQRVPCVGRVIPKREFLRAEWFTLQARDGRVYELRGRLPVILEEARR